MKILYNTLAVAAVALSLQGCTDWDDHYDPGVSGNATSTLWENISSREDLSDFASILKKTGYDQVLSTQQTYTVWAPTNSVLDSKMDSLNNVSDSLLLMEFVKNHVARNNYGATGSVDKQVRMVNGKMLTFEGSGDQYTMGNVALQDINLASKNGVFYTTKDMIPFHANFYEYLDKNSNLDSLATFYHLYDKNVLDKTASVAGPIVDGEVTYLDEVYNKTNELYSYYNAYINAEDSSYSMILPTNAAWDKAKATASSYYKYVKNYEVKQFRATTDTIIKSDVIDADSLTNIYTKTALTNNLVFSNNMYGNNILNTTQSGLDTLVTTTHSVFRGSDADELFAGAQRVPMSNGTGYIVNELNFKPWRAWAPVIKIQGESLGYNAKVQYTSSSSVVSVNSSNRNPKVIGSVSNNAFYQVIAASDRSRPEVYYYIPNVLSTTYVVYGIFVPANIVDTTATAIPYKVRATIYYNTNAGKTTSVMSTTKTVSFAVDDKPLTDVAKVDTVSLGEYTFPVAYSGLDNIYPAIQISAMASNREVAAKTFDNDLRIDCILLVPKELDEYRKAHPNYRWDD